MKPWILFALASFALAGCESNNVVKQYDMGGSYAAVKQQSILDPDASVRTEGKLNSLDGQYGSNVMENYRESTYEPKEARTELSDFRIGNQN